MQLPKKVSEYLRKSPNALAFIIVLVVAVIGTYLLVSTHAATPSIAINADSGSVAGNASKQACTGSSDGNCVMFNTGSTTTAKMIGLNGTFDNGNYDYTANAESMGAQWYRMGMWGDNTDYEYTGCGGNTSGEPQDNPAYYLPASQVDSATCGTPRVANLLANHKIGLFPLLVDYSVSFVQPGSCNVSGDSYSQCLAACSNPAQVASVTCTDQLAWVQNAVHVATTYAKGGSYWQGKTDYGSPVIEMGNEVYLGGPLIGQPNGQCDGGYKEVDDECQNPGAYAKMLALAASAVDSATNNRVKLLASQIPTYTGTDGTTHHWLADMQAAVPNIESMLGGVVSHPYGDISSLKICDDDDNVNNCTNSNPVDFTYQQLAETHSEWSIPVYVTEVGQQAASNTPGNPTGQVGYTEQCQAMNYYFDQLRQNTWEAALLYYQETNFNAYVPDNDLGWGLIGNASGQGNATSPNLTTQAWYAYQSQALHQTDYNCG
jgi:hypothetical protein